MQSTAGDEWMYYEQGGAPMNYVEQEILLNTEFPFGRDVPIAISADVFNRLQDTARPCVRMALEGASVSAGSPPSWLECASDIRTLGFSARDGRTVLHVSAPKLGDAAPRLFEQHALFPGVALPEDTAIQVLSRVAHAVSIADAASELYDQQLLRRFCRWGGILGKELVSLDLPGGGAISGGTVLDKHVIENARTLSNQTPSPRQVRVVGKLDMVRYSTRSFGLLLDNDDEIHGVLVEGTSETLQSYWGKEITVLGKAIYRPSGSLLRLDASEILESTEGRSVFSTIPPPFAGSRRVDRKPQTGRTGVSAFFGTWPGDETDDELIRELAEIRH
jgi:hypothetical protein